MKLKKTLKLNKRHSLEDRVYLVDVFNMKNPTEDELYYLNEYFKEDYNKRDNNKWLVVHVNNTTHQFENEMFLNDEELLKSYKTYDMFTKADRSSFKYWFAHWCGFQITALNLGIWKFKYLFHDCEKPWLKLFWNYKRVQKFHRTTNRHHLEYGLENGWDEIDWEALMIDWECCGLSKQEAQLDARETLEYEVSKEKWAPYEDQIRDHLEPLLNKYLL